MLQEIDHKTKAYSEAYEELSDLITEMQDKQGAIARQFMPRIKRAVNRLAEKEADLKAAVDTNRALFDKPRTQVLYGFKVGLQKMIGKVRWKDGKAVVGKLMEVYSNWKKFVNIEYKPSADALKELSAGELKKLGVTIEDTSDVIVIRPVASEIEKLVNAFLKEKGEELEKEYQEAA